MYSKDLREYIKGREKAGDLKRIKREVDWNLELSHVAKLNEEKGGPVLIFENIKDYSKRSQGPDLTEKIFSVG